MFTDELRARVCQQVRQSELQAFGQILTPTILAQAAAQAGLRLGKGPLNRAILVWLAISAALRPTLDFAGVLSVSFKLMLDAGRLPEPPARKQPRCKDRRRNCSRSKRANSKRCGSKPTPARSKHDPRKPPQSCPTEEAFCQARRLMPQGFWVCLILLLGQLFHQKHQSLLNWNGFRLLVLDGTCISLPRYKALGKHFGRARNKKGTPRPQARLVMLMLGSVRLPWRYTLGPRKSGESTLAKGLLEHLAPNDLLLMDRGFFNYGLFAQIQNAGAFFAIRRTKQPKFKTLRKLGLGDRIVRWTPVSRKWKGASIELRVIDYQIKGFRKSAIVTNQLDRRRITREQFLGLNTSSTWVTRRDQGLYHQRWQIETCFAELKCVQQMQGGLRGRTPRAIEYEVAGHVLLHLLVRWLMVEAAVEAGVDPLSLSFTAALREIVYAANLLPALPSALQRQLLAQLLKRIAEHRVPFRPGRRYPRPNDRYQRKTGAGYRIPHAKLR